MTDDRREKLQALFSRRSLLKKSQMNPGYKEFVSRFFMNEYRSRTIVIAGTNGKGSTCYWLSRLLASQGQSVGLFTSPHLRHVEERLQINNIPISSSAFIKLLDQFNGKSWGDQTDHFSFFETLTFLAHYHFFSVEKVDWAIFEVGVGGRNDPVNLIPHKFSLVTNVGLDHTDLLGPTWQQIVEHKVGIFEHSDVNYVTDTGLQSYLRDKNVSFEGIPSSLSIATALGIKLLNQNLDSDLEIISTLETQFFKEGDDLQSAMKTWPEWKIRNFLSAVFFAQIITEKTFSRTVLSDIVKKEWPGRFQEIELLGRSVILSGDHNEDGLYALTDALDKLKAKSKPLTVRILLGINPLKDTSKFEEILSSCGPVESIPQTVFSGRQLEETAVAEAQRLESLKSFVADKIKDLAVGEQLVITGSLYLIGQISEAFDINLFENS